MLDISLLAAFLAGVLSITSPCVLPLIPVYLAHLAGVSFDERSAGARTRVMANAVAFVLGFSLVFVLLGVSFGLLGTVMQDQRVWLVRVGGLLLIAMGLHVLGLIRIPFLEQQRRVEVSASGGSVARVTSSLVVGAAFGAGWTLAAGSADTVAAAMLLGTYSAGFAVPMLAAAAAFGTAPRAVRWLNQRMAVIESLSGGLILAIGVILILGIYEQLFAELAGRAPWRPWEPDI
jgi:cytochrome c-type biogenesis protein